MIEQAYGGMLPLSEERRKNLTQLFDGWKRNRPDDPEALAKDIDHACAWVEFEQERFETTLSAGEHRQAIQVYIDCLQKAQNALKDLPIPAESVMGQNAVCRRNRENTQGNDLWLQLGLSGPHEVLGMLSELAGEYLEHHAPLPRKRQRYDLMMIRAVARACEDHGLIVGQADRGHFPDVIKVIAPTDSIDGQRDKIRQAFNLGKYSKN